MIAEVQNGLGFFIETNPLSGITFSFEIRDVQLDIRPIPRPTTSRRSGATPRWRHRSAPTGAAWTRTWRTWRTRPATRWTYCAFFTKYPLAHFAYAFIGGPRLANGLRQRRLGPDNIDRVFAHETGHIFGAPDEYAAATATAAAAGAATACRTSTADLRHGRRRRLPDERQHLGSARTPATSAGPRARDPSFGTNPAGRQASASSPIRAVTDAVTSSVSATTASGRAGGARGRLRATRADRRGLRVRRRPLACRAPSPLLADTTGDGCPTSSASATTASGSPRSARRRLRRRSSSSWTTWATAAAGASSATPASSPTRRAMGRDIVGFGNDGVWVARAIPRRLRAHGARDRRPRLQRRRLARRAPPASSPTRAATKADVVGFGNDGVWLSRALPGGGFGAPRAGDRGPRLQRRRLARRAPPASACGHHRRPPPRHRRLRQRRRLVRARLPGGLRSAAARRGRSRLPRRGWRVERHPRFLADTTGDGCADIIGFGNDGVWVARAVGRGGFGAPQFVMPHYGYDAGHWVVPGWRSESHLRLLADMTGDRRADILGFEAGGAYLSSL